MDGPTTAATRLQEAKAAAALLGAEFYPPISDDLMLGYTGDALMKVAAIVRAAQPSIVLTHALSDYMEDHMNAARLAVTGAFAHGIKNITTDPPLPPFSADVTVYHALPHGLRDPLRQRVRAGLYVNTGPVHELKRSALACHASQRDWLYASQGMDSYLVTQEETSRAIGKLSGCFTLAEGWNRHLHLGFSTTEIDPLLRSLGSDAHGDTAHEASLDRFS
jgi:LmbE family N-acetylglucosaminyl deacetylase